MKIDFSAQLIITSLASMPWTYEFSKIVASINNKHLLASSGTKDCLRSDRKRRGTPFLSICTTRHSWWNESFICEKVKLIVWP